MSTSTDTPTISSHLAAPLTVGAPQVRGPLAVYPLTGPDPVLEYRSFAQAVGLGASVKELQDGASVRDLLIENPTTGAILLYEGEEVLGAQQNRTFDVSVLVPPQSALRVPVSCVEAGRWDGRRHRESFAPAPQAAHPDMRRYKNAEVAQSLAAGSAARADQGAVWARVDEKAARLGVDLPTGALHDVFEGRRSSLHGMTAGLDPVEGQQGALVAIGGRFDVLDRVSRPDVWTALHAPLLQGYALDALEAREAPVPSQDEAQAFVDELCAMPARRRDGIGMGGDLRFSGRPAAGAALVHGDELVQLTAFVATGEQAPGPLPAARIRRPSRRR